MPMYRLENYLNLIASWANLRHLRRARTFQLLATTLLPEFPKPGTSSTISITPIPWFSAQIQAPGSAEFGQQGIS